jgi:hypothetical protein
MLETATYRTQVANHVPTRKFEIQPGNVSRGRTKDRRREAFSPPKDQLSWLFKLRRIRRPIYLNNGTAQLHEDPIAEEKRSIDRCHCAAIVSVLRNRMMRCVLEADAPRSRILSTTAIHRRQERTSITTFNLICNVCVSCYTQPNSGTKHSRCLSSRLFFTATMSFLLERATAHV